MSGLFLTILRMSLMAGLVILMVLVLRLCLRRAPRIFSYALWSVVLVRLLCPVSFSTPVSALGLAERVFPEVSIWTQEQSGTIEGGAADGNSKAAGYTVLRQNGQSTTRYTVTYEDEETVSEKMRPGKLLKASAILWAVGMACMLGYGLISMIKLRRRLCCSVCSGGNVYLADDLTEPCVVGLLRPRIYLPSGLDGRERDCVMLHERRHIRRGDPVIRLLAYLSLCVHWFNPLVWAAYVLSGRDMELSCDEAVLRQAGGDIRAAYAAALLNMSAGRRLLPVGALPFGDSHPKARISHIMNYRKPALWGVIAAFALCATGIVCMASNPVKESTEETLTVESTIYEEQNESKTETVTEIKNAEQTAEKARKEEEQQIREAVQEQETLINAEQTAEKARKEEEQRIREAVQEQEALINEEQLALQMEEFFWAYFSGDSENVKEFLSASFDGDIETYEGPEKLMVIGDTTGLPNGGGVADSEEPSLSKSFIISDEDTWSYLTADFAKEYGEWKVTWYGLEK